MLALGGALCMKGLDARRVFIGAFLLRLFCHGFAPAAQAATLTPAASAGNPQSTPVNSSFTAPLEVRVTDANGTGQTGVTVTFSPPVFGPSATVSSPTALTDTTGRAHVTATANGVAGSYRVTATVPGGASPAIFVLANVNSSSPAGPCLVTSPADDNGSGTLRYQVAACGKGGVITFASGLGTVYLTQGQDIQLTQDLTIQGTPYNSIDGSSLSRIFFVSGGSITLQSLSIQNGVARGGNGANAYFAGGGAAGAGGAIFVNGGSVAIANSSFSFNRAIGGNGGVFGEGIGAAGGGGGFGANGGVDGVGGGGGDFGSSGGTGADGSGGSVSTATSPYTSVSGGYLAGGPGGNATGGFGGGGGSYCGTGGFGSPGGSFGGIGAWCVGGDGGGGAGLGGAIFTRAPLVLYNVSFGSNSAIGGSAATDAGQGQGKGGALFIGNNTTVVGTVVSFFNNTASDAGINTPCSSVVGAGALDSNSVCGVLSPTPSIYVVDTGNFRVEKLNSDGYPLLSFGSRGSGHGQFNNPSGIALDAGGNIWVADAANNVVQKFDPNGNFVLAFGSTGSGPGQLYHPYGLAIDSSGNVWVADTGNNRIQKFASNGSFLLQLGGLGGGNGQFNAPFGVAIDPGGNVWVADTANNRIQKLTSSGTFLLKFGSFGNANGLFEAPYGIAADSAGNVWIADTDNQRVQEFSNGGGFLRAWGGGFSFPSPYGIAVDASGMIWAVDSNNAWVAEFSPGGGKILQNGTPGYPYTSFQLYHPSFVAVQ